MKIQLHSKQKFHNNILDTIRSEYSLNNGNIWPQYPLIQNTTDFTLHNIIHLIHFVWGFFPENNKNNTPRKELSFSSFNKPRTSVQGNSFNAKNNVLQTKLPPPPRNVFGGFQRQESLYSDAGSFCGHDDSTTTSGSYVLDQEDIFDGLNSSLHRGQCIVWGNIFISVLQVNKDAFIKIFFVKTRTEVPPSYNPYVPNTF